MLKYLVTIVACAVTIIMAAGTFECSSRHACPQTASSPSSQVATTEATKRTTTLRFIKRLQDGKPRDDEADITALAESPDGKRLAWGDIRGTVRVCCLAYNKTSTVLDLSYLDITAGRTVEDVAFDDKGQLWWVDARRNIYRWKPMGDQIGQIRRVARAAEIAVVSSNLLPWGVLSWDAKFVWAWPPKDMDYLRVFEVKTGKVHDSEAIFPKQRGVNALVQHAVRSPDGKLLMAVADGDAALLSLPDMKILRRFGQGWGESAAFSPSSKLVALGTYGHGVFVWETETGKLVKKIPFRRAAVIDSLVFVGENVLYAADLPLSRIDLKTGAVVPVAQVNACVLLISKSGDRLFVGTREGGVEVYDLPSKDARHK